MRGGIGPLFPLRLTHHCLASRPGLDPGAHYRVTAGLCPMQALGRWEQQAALGPVSPPGGPPPGNASSPKAGVGGESVPASPCSIWLPPREAGTDGWPELN